jgi:hypothetical protein
MLLIGADMGINTTDKVLESVRKNASSLKPLGHWTLWEKI